MAYLVTVVGNLHIGHLLKRASKQDSNTKYLFSSCGFVLVSGLLQL